MDGRLPVFDVGVGNDVEDNRTELGLSHGLSLLGILIDGNSRPYHLTLLEERVVVVAVILLDESQEVIDDGRGGDSSFVIAVVIKEAIQKDMLQGFTAEAFVFTLGKIVWTEAAGITREKG